MLTIFNYLFMFFNYWITDTYIIYFYNHYVLIFIRHLFYSLFILGLSDKKTPLNNIEGSFLDHIYQYPSSRWDNHHDTNDIDNDIFYVIHFALFYGSLFSQEWQVTKNPLTFVKGFCFMFIPITSLYQSDGITMMLMTLMILLSVLIIISVQIYKKYAMKLFFRKKLAIFFFSLPKKEAKKSRLTKVWLNFSLNS